MDSRFNTQGVGRAGRKASFQTQAREDIPPLPTKPGDLGGGEKSQDADIWVQKSGFAHWLRITRIHGGGLFSSRFPPKISLDSG